MKAKPISNLLQYIILALFMVFPGLAVNAQTTNNSRTDRDVMGKALPPIDRNPPKFFNTASFGLG